MRHELSVRLAIAIGCASALAGCAINSPPSTAELQRDALPHTAMPAQWKATSALSAPLADSWLASFNDPALSALVDEALAYNADLQLAAARVEQAAGLVKVASGALYPSLGVAAVESGNSGAGGGLNAVFLNASLELDVWGRMRYGQAAARSQSAAAEADYAYARQSLAALVAKSWFVAIEAGVQQAMGEEALRSAQELLRIAQERLRVGVGDEQAVAEARANVGNFRDTLRQTAQAREQALRSLELLLGRYPAAEMTVAAQLSPMPPPPPVGMPSQLLERRPDVVAAERRVAAAFNRVGEARAVFGELRETAGDARERVAVHARETARQVFFGDDATVPDDEAQKRDQPEARDWPGNTAVFAEDTEQQTDDEDRKGEPAQIGHRARTRGVALGFADEALFASLVLGLLIRFARH